jgi:hypothetical protein
MRGLAKPTLIVMMGAFLCATGILFSLWLGCSRGPCPLLLLPGSVALSGIFIMVLGMKLQEIELFIRDLLKGKGQD